MIEQKQCFIQIITMCLFLYNGIKQATEKMTKWKKDRKYWQKFYCSREDVVRICLHCLHFVWVFSAFDGRNGSIIHPIHSNCSTKILWVSILSRTQARGRKGRKKVWNLINLFWTFNIFDHITNHLDIWKSK